MKMRYCTFVILILSMILQTSDTISLTYEVLTTTQPSYLNNLISVQPPRTTRSSSVVTLSHPPTISSSQMRINEDHR